MGHFLNFGAGPNQLPAPWQNLTVEHDIRKPLRFDDASASRILAEHVIEHVPYEQGFRFLQQCHRILQPGGVLRLCFPDPSGLLAIGVDTHRRAPFYVLGERCRRYSHLLAERQRAIGGAASADVSAGLLELLQGWGHLSVWTLYGAVASLLGAGFERVLSYQYGQGPLGEFDGHHLTVGAEIAELETVCLEAAK